MCSCPMLFPNKTCISKKLIVIWGYFDNLDGLMLLFCVLAVGTGSGVPAGWIEPPTPARLKLVPVYTPRRRLCAHGNGTRSMAESLGIKEAQRSFRSAADSIVDALISHGFSARAELSENGQLKILSEHCPFGSMPIEHPVICAVDQGLVRGMLSVLYGDAETDLTSSLPMGNKVCVTQVSI